MTVILNLSSHFKRDLVDGNWWYSASAILFDLMASPTPGIADQAAINLQAAHNKEQFLNFTDAIKSDNGPVELAILLHYLNRLRAAAVNLITSDLMCRTLAGQLADSLRSILLLN